MKAAPTSNQSNGMNVKDAARHISQIRNIVPYTVDPNENIRRGSLRIMWWRHRNALKLLCEDEDAIPAGDESRFTYTKGVSMSILVLEGAGYVSPSEFTWRQRGLSDHVKKGIRSDTAGPGGTSEEHLVDRGIVSTPSNALQHRIEETREERKRFDFDIALTPADESCFVDFRSVKLVPFPLFRKPVLSREVLLDFRYDILVRRIRLPEVVRREADCIGDLVASHVTNLGQASGKEISREGTFTHPSVGTRLPNSLDRASLDASLLGGA